MVENKAVPAAPTLEMLPCLRAGCLSHSLRFSPGALHLVREQDAIGGMQAQCPPG